MYKYLLLPIIFWIVFTSCSNDEYPPQETHKRTVIVYLGRDNNLNGESEDKLKYMLEGWNGKNGNLIVFQDIIGENSSLLEVYRENGINQSKVVKEYENENSADPDVLNRVINEAISRYPADSYGLIFFSHASGWLPQSTLSSPRSLVIDNTSGKDEMELIDFAAAIPDGLFDFIVFEACFTAGIEVAYELRNKTDYLIASSAEILSPGYQKIYTTSLNYLFEKEAKLEAFTKDIYNLVSTGNAHYESGTFSLIKTSGLYELGTFLRESIDREKINSVNISDIQHFDRYSYRLFFDFEDYFSRILKDDASPLTLKSLIADCIPYKAATPSFLVNYSGFNINLHSGLTTYIEQERFPYLNTEYKKLAWYKTVLSAE
ncbi:hypothetical protein M2459_003353 [Parabacteroides sp. PF5-5]|uniref:clostripain-related cysteine peptidase n=1 Tax=unclassified Parabacteroides TaxID=2649774 RepID=UPI002476BCF8|nr:MULTISPECIES: clostripain-related cysteine peptidase [unclassified Parabacteroides]MDH6306654.1 hypothetical protein [Parabacteroides sp. PH5-39]MDH6317621.1 hypothetical protein [Parabacteroides sp. PF5-13]MDH6321365.1 hypothetical protein [Parabacteroides sp. PH5-13]MDH6325070.1 hypothetical protein [Parabacteroides sp. PH5-8]MDH6328779.1 hypothetical protein [Parabacteroides sp. PH5-41]